MIFGVILSQIYNIFATKQIPKIYAMRQYIAMNMFLWFVGTMAWDSLSMGRYATKAGVKRMTRGLCS